MASKLQTTTLSTLHGELYITYITLREPNPTKPTILFIHGNSFSSKIFHPLLESSLSNRYPLLAFDLPGHGSSSNAPNPEISYTQPAYAEAALQVLSHFKIEKVIVFGWSLGGHAAIEMLSMNPSLVQGIMIVGTPPVNKHEIAKGFTSRTKYPSRDDLTEEEMLDYAKTCADPPYESWMGDDVKRTDQRARGVMFRHFVAGRCSDQRDVVENSQRLVAVVNGSEEPYINLDFVRGIEYNRLWKEKCIEIEGLLHAPFWADRERFEKIVGDFAEDVTRYVDGSVKL